MGVDQLNCFVFLGDLSEIVSQPDGCIVLLVILYFVVSVHARSEGFAKGGANL